jgi:hypothetical protein
VDWLLTKKHELAVGVIGELGVIVSASRQPSDDEWHEHLAQVVSASRAQVIRAVIIDAPRGGPTGAQRAEARRRAADMATAELRRVLLVSESSIARMAASAIGTFAAVATTGRINVRAVSDKHRDDGMAWLAEVARFDAADLRVSLRALRRDLLGR